MQSALALQAEEARFFRIVDSVNRFGGVHIADRDIAFFPERVIGQVVLLEIAVDIAVGPVGDRMDFPSFTLGLEEGYIAAA